MPTVGDVLFATRAKIPDMPQALPAPFGSGSTAVSSIAGVYGQEFQQIMEITFPAPMTIPAGQLITYTAGSNPALNGQYTIGPQKNPTTYFLNYQFFPGIISSTGGVLSNGVAIAVTTPTSSTLP